MGGILGFGLLAALLGCGDIQTGDDVPDAGGAGADAGLDTDAAPEDPSEVLFPSDRILEIEITLAAADWEALRNEDGVGVPKTTCANQPGTPVYTYFPGEITVDGVTVANVGVRKKGGFGSISTARPGLKIKTNEYVPGQELYGLKRLTLNNNKQDPSQISQCLGYGLWRAAGLPASRCAFAHVTVNGEDLGLYSHVESIKKEFLRRHFADETGRLYESGGDFAPGQTGGFQPKVNKVAPDCSDLAPVVTALQAPDAELRDTLDAVVDVDAFLTYWAMEVVTDHWDGYANNRNNYFFYHDPTSDKLYFIPWGIDALFTGRERSTRPSSVFACGAMTWRLYDAPETRALYLAKLRSVLDSVWDESAILAEIDRMQALIEPIADPGVADEIDRVRDFVSSRRGELLAELDAGDPVWPYESGEASCRISLGTVTATFDTTWDTLDTFGVGSGTMDGNIAGTSVATSAVYASAGLSAENKGVIQVFGELPDGRFAIVFIQIQDPVNVAPGTRAVDLANVAAFMTFYDPMTDSTSGGGLMLGGSLTLTSAGTLSGDSIVGSITSEVLEL